MIEELRITELGVIADATCRFASGFTAVTGETGAGKTMVVTGLGLLAGSRADPGLVRSGAAEAVVEGRLDAPDRATERAVVEAGGTVDPDGLVAARVVSSRGRCVLGGRTVPLAVLSEVMGQLLVIHGQHDQTRLSARAVALLDAYAGREAQQLAAEARVNHGALRAAERELAELRTSAQEGARELAMLEHALAEIAEVDPKPGEETRLAREAERLANAEGLVSAARLAHAAISSDAESPEGSDALGLLQLARRALEEAPGHDVTLGQSAEAIRSVMVHLVEIASDLARYAEDVEADPRRLAAVMERRADVSRVIRKYGSTAEDVRAWAAQAADRVAHLSGAQDRSGELVRSVEQRRAALAHLCSRLHALRVQAAQRFADEVSTELEGLAMPHARVEFSVTTRPDPAGLRLPPTGGEVFEGPVALHETGVDEVVLLLASGRGAPLRPLGQAASGGELSRILLAIRVVLAGADTVPTMVFDEVDAGVGGAAAIEVGRRLQRLSAQAQVIVVTHLPQVAAFADSHLVVTKDSSGAVTESTVREVEGEDRVRELSRMLAGLSESEAAGAHARELLDLAQQG